MPAPKTAFVPKHGVASSRVPGWALCAAAWCAFAMPGLAFDPVAKTAARPGPASAVSAPELRQMARKLARARPAAAAAKTGPLPASPLAAWASGRPAVPPATFGIGPRTSLPAFAETFLARNPIDGTPISADAKALRSPVLSPAVPLPDRAMAWFLANRELLKLANPGDELRLAGVATDALGWSHAQFRQERDGVPVWGASIHAHFDGKGALASLTSRYFPTPKLHAGASWRLDARAAVRRAEDDLRRRAPIGDFGPELRRLLDYEGPAAERNVWMGAADGMGRLAWRVEIRPDIRGLWRYFIDAGTGDILEKYDASNSDGPKTATAADLAGVNRSLNTYQVGSNYYLIDATRKSFNPKGALPNDPKGALWTVDARNTDLTNVSQVSSASNSWNDPAAVSAHYNLGRIYEYFLGTFGRVGIDGAGGNMIAVVHVTEQGKPMENAYWNGKAMVYGDGKTAFQSLARGMDVAAHEMTHGIIGATVNLEYKFQSGALNESLADVFGAMVDREDWKIGEDVVKTAVFPSGALRDMEDPHNGGTSRSSSGWQPAHMSEFVQLGIQDDNGGVHVNSGIPNRACFLIANAIGRDKTEKIYFRVMDARYLNPGSQFIDMRLAAIRAASDLYGESSPEVAAVKDGFAGVGIGGGSAADKPTPKPEDAPPVEGVDLVAAINADPGDNSLYVAKPVISADSDIVQLSTTQVYTGTGNPIAIPDDGSALLFIDESNALRGIDDQGEQIVSADGIWKSIAVSPDGRKVAATTVEPDAKIYLLDLDKPDSSKAIPLYTPTTGLSAKANNVVYADALDFNSTGEFLLYDALNRVVQTEGDSIEYWDANLLDLASGVITPFLPARPDGIGIGNPAFAQTSDLNLAFDLFDESTGAFTVVAADLFTGGLRAIDSGGSTPGFPRFSTRDDKIVFQRAEGAAMNLLQLPLKADKLTPAGPAAAYLSNAQKPVWFAIGKRPTGILWPSRRPRATGFAPAGDGRLRLDLPSAADIRVEIFDFRGRSVGLLEKGRRAAGSHRIAWRSDAPRGVYLARAEIRPVTGGAARLACRFVR